MAGCQLGTKKKKSRPPLKNLENIKTEGSQGYSARLHQTLKTSEKAKTKERSLSSKAAYKKKRPQSKEKVALKLKSKGLTETKRLNLQSYSLVQG